MIAWMLNPQIKDRVKKKKLYWLEPHYRGKKREGFSQCAAIYFYPEIYCLTYVLSSFSHFSRNWIASLTFLASTHHSLLSCCLSDIFLNVLKFLQYMIYNPILNTFGVCRPFLKMQHRENWRGQALESGRCDFKYCFSSYQLCNLEKITS